MKSKIFSVIALLTAGVIGLAFMAPDQAKPWPVPAKYESMKNPVKADNASVAAGKVLWTKHCKSCHGMKGLGDGPKAAQLDTPAGDFSTASFHKQSDGALFYKSHIGRDDMPNYEKKIPDEEDVWHLVNFMRTLKK